MIKKFFPLIIILLNSIIYSQPNTVALKQPDGTLISTHATLSEAYNAIPSSVNSGYLIEFLPGYDASQEIFPIILSAKSGVNDTNRIIIRPAANNTFVNIVGNLAQPIIRLDDADYLTFDGRPGGIGNEIGMKIENQYSGSGAHTIQLINGATNNIFQYLHVKGASINTAGPRNFDISTSANNPTGNSYNIFRNLKVEGSRSGFGFAGTAANPNSDNIIQNCEIFNFGYAGVWYSSQTRGGIIEECQIYQTQGSNSTIVSGIITGASSIGDILIRKNKIYGIQTAATSGSSLRGIYITPATGSYYKIENNFISMNLSGGSNITAYYGIHFAGTNQFQADVYYNTIYIGGLQQGGGTAGNVVSAGIFFANSSASSIFNSKNNICVNFRTSTYGVLHLANHISNTSAQLNIDYNTYYVPAQTYSYNAGWGTSYFTDLIQYQTAASPNESHTKFNQVFFVSETDLHLTGSSIGDTELIGTPIAGITTDIDGDLRNPISPYKGADEPVVQTQIGWCNLQWPPSSTINPGDTLRVYAQIWIEGITPVPGPTAGLSAWIGVNSENTNPSTWTNWYPAFFNMDVGNNDEYMADIGFNLTPGIYYYASKFQYGSEIKYGGYNQSGGGFWDGVNNVSGVLNIQAPLTNIQFQVDSLWNIISLPGLPIETNKDSLFPGNVSNAYWFNGSNYVAENNLSQGKGYWLKFNQSQTVTIPVVVSNQLSINVNEGWNLIGTLHNDISVSNVTTNPPNLLASYFYGYAKRYYQADVLQKGKGYWIKANQSGTITLTTTSKSSTLTYSETIDYNWPMLIFRDKNGNEQRLYFASQFDKSKYELPPIPPAGSFDVRFESNRYIEDLNSYSKNVIINCDVDYLELEARNLDFKIHNYFDSENNYAVIKDGERIIISTKNLASLKIEPVIKVNSYELMQNYPNPFNAQTKISFSLPKDEFVEIKLFNLLGQEIKTLISENKASGFYTLEINFEDLPSGIYIYKLRAGSFNDIKKMVLMK